MTLRHHVIGQLAFLDVQFHADHISFRSPGINEHTHIGFSFEQRIKLRNVLLPGNGFFPVRDIDRTAGCRQRIVGRTEVSHPERRHKTHQFHRRKIILARNNTDHVLIFGAVHFRKLLLSFSNVQQVDDRFLRQHKDRTRLVPAVSVGSQFYLYIHINVTLVLGKRYFLQQNTSVHQTHHSVAVRSRIIGNRIGTEAHPLLLKHRQVTVALCRIFLRPARRKRKGCHTGRHIRKNFFPHKFTF